MNRILESKTYAWIFFGIILAVIIFTFKLRGQWWSYIDLFFAFMMVFSHLISITIKKYNLFAARKLDVAALLFGVLMLLAIIGECIVARCI